MKPTFLIGGIGVVIVTLVGYNMIYVPQQRQMARIQAQVEQERARQVLEADVAALLRQIQRQRIRLPQEPDSSWLVNELVELAQKAGVQLTTINQETPQALGQFTRLAVNLQVSASFHQLGAFLDEVERSNRFIRVERIDINRTGQQELPSVRLLFSTVYVPSGTLPGVAERS